MMVRSMAVMPKLRIAETMKMSRMAGLDQTKRSPAAILEMIETLSASSACSALPSGCRIVAIPTREATNESALNKNGNMMLKPNSSPPSGPPAKLAAA